MSARIDCGQGSLPPSRMDLLALPPPGSVRARLQTSPINSEHKPDNRPTPSISRGLDSKVERGGCAATGFSPFHLRARRSWNRGHTIKNPGRGLSLWP